MPYLFRQMHIKQMPYCKEYLDYLDFFHRQQSKREALAHSMP